jgi:hypothetical protein
MEFTEVEPPQNWPLTWPPGDDTWNWNGAINEQAGRPGGDDAQTGIETPAIEEDVYANTFSYAYDNNNGKRRLILYKC